MEITQIYSAAVTEFLQKQLYVKSCDNLAFLTLRFNKPKRDCFYAKDDARRIYSRMLNQLQGKNWHKHPLPSVTIIEHGKTNVYHVHSVFNLCEHSMTDLDIALSNTCHTYPYLYLTYDMQYLTEMTCPNYSPVMNHLFVKKVFSEDVFNYVVKEYDFRSDHIDFGNLWTSQAMFNPS